MTWMGGIRTRAHIPEAELRNKLDLMMKAAYPASGGPAANPGRCTSCSVDAEHGKALMAVSLPLDGTPSHQVYTDPEAKLALSYDGYFYGSESIQYKATRVRHRGNGAVADSLLALLAELPGEVPEKVSQALSALDGDYALAVSDADQTVVCRNTLGTRPLYFAKNESLSAFASNKKPLWKMGFDEVRALRAAMLATLDSQGVTTRQTPHSDGAPATILEMPAAVDEYERALCSAIHKRLAGTNQLRRVGVLLSGGVDSCLIAKLIHDIAPGMGLDVVAYTVGLPDSPDVAWARRFAEYLGIRHKMAMLSVERIEQYIPEVIEAVEDSDFVQIETGIGIYAAVDMASKDGARILFSGQGPDEQWGGYSWYPRVLGKDGRQQLCRRMWEDFTMADIETLDRENKIAMAHDVELLFPYLDSLVVSVARSVTSELKVTSEDDHLGKHPHRQLAIKVGVPEQYSNRAKLAIQHGTGIHGVLDSIARNRGFDPGLVKSIGYKNEDITAVKMGSSSRYGYRYGDRKLWQVPQHVQLFLHALAYQRGLLDRPVRDRIGHFLNKAAVSSPVQA